MSEGSTVTSFPFVLRFTEMVFSIIAFSVIVEYRGSSEYNYIMFTGISGFILAFFFMLFYIAGNKGIRGKLSAVVDAIWWVFWLAAAAVATHLLTNSVTNNSRTRASCAFSWMTWVMWTLSLIISVRETQGYEY